MWKWAKLTLAVTAALLAAFLLATALLPTDYIVDRSIRIQAAPEAVFPHLIDLRKWQTWIPLRVMDPDIQFSLGERSAGEGATLSWQSNRVGNGMLTIETVRENSHVAARFVFAGMEDFPAIGTILLVRETTSTHVVWTYEGSVGELFYARWTVLFMESILGTTLDQSLLSLKRIVETDQTTSR